ncbi:AraC family transcriptional regulator [Brevibacterium yomogidense]|uniref:AraC family transcriptional regulator n=1 Tax=Brevibacterium yomogidense TaxID=946573 RepID=UPI0018DFBA67|nr:AraC family transcriptional regulator [Brevibacterium yomogidense]
MIVPWWSGRAGPDLETLALPRRARDRMARVCASPRDLESLALSVHLSPAHFSRQFKRAYGESPYSYLMTCRIERAAVLLRIIAKGAHFGADLATPDLATPDLDATFAAIVAAGGEVVQGLIEQDCGLRDAAVRDPAGNLIRIQEGEAGHDAGIAQDALRRAAGAAG